MGRLVRPTRIVVAHQPTGGVESIVGTDGAPAETVVRNQGDTYLERVGKYVPAELVAFYIFANSILKQSLQPPGTMAGYSVTKIGVIVFFAAWLFTPIYLWRLRNPGDAVATNIFAASLLFPLWAYAVEGVGPMQFVPFDGHLASIVLGAASLGSGLLAPSPTQPASGANGAAGAAR